MYRIFLCMLLISITLTRMSAQQLTVGVTNLSRVCPNLQAEVSVTSSIDIDTNCVGVKIWRGGGTTDSINIYASAWTIAANRRSFRFNYTFLDDGTMDSVEVVRKESNCPTYDSPKRPIDVRTIKNRVPVVTGDSTKLIVGYRRDLTYQASLTYPDGVTPVRNFTWTVPSGWFILSGQGTDRILVTTDENGEGCITATGVNNLCPAASNSASSACFFVKRYVPMPCPVVSNLGRDYLLCGDTTAVTFTARRPEVPPGTNVTYNWTLPTGWTVASSAGSAIDIKPNGRNGGTLIVTATALGKTSDPCILNVQFKIVDPNTYISGLRSFLCEGSAPFFLNLIASTQTTVTWNVTPSNTTIPSNGTGISAAISPYPGNQSHSKLVFTMTNVCGSETKESSLFWTGKPRLFNLNANGTPTTAGTPWSPGALGKFCPGWGSVYFLADVQGSTTNCTQWTQLSNYNPIFTNCREMDIVKPIYFSDPCVAVKASATNVCGTTDVFMSACPADPWECRTSNWWDNWGRIVVTPNPAHDIATVSFESDDNMGDKDIQPLNEAEMSNFKTPILEILDLSGKVVYQKELSEEGAKLDINVAYLPNGMYLIKLQTPKKVLTQKLVISH